MIWLKNIARIYVIMKQVEIQASKVKVMRVLLPDTLKGKGWMVPDSGFHGLAQSFAIQTWV